MKKLLFILLIFTTCKAQIPTRANSFFGIAMDFSPTATNTNIGGTTTLTSVGAFLDLIKPDYLQVYAKGATGYAVYPTATGTIAPGLVANNFLQVFRQATTSRNMGLYAYYSALADDQAVKKHPDWGRLDATGKQQIVGGSADVSLFSPYVTNYFVPQLKEISNLGFDGYWMDFDTWAMSLDYSINAANAYYSYYKKPLPKLYSDPDMHNYIQFTRAAYHKYMSYYANALHAFNPKLQIGSDWANVWMYGAIDNSIDYLTGDLNSDNADDVEYEARLLAGNNKPWDMMEWVKLTALPMEKKAAMVMAQGGGYEIYITQHTDGAINTDYNNQVLATAKFCKARKAYCWKSVPIPQVAILLSEYGYAKEASSIFSNTEGTLGNVKAMLSQYLDMRYSAQVLQEHEFNANLNVYPLIVIPGWADIDPAFVVKLKAYVNNGGKLFIIGVAANGLFNEAVLLHTTMANPLGLPVNVYKYGAGKIIGFPVDYSMNGLNSEIASTVIQVLSNCTTTLFNNPIITVQGVGNIHVNAAMLNNERIFHIINIDSLNTVTGTLNVSLKLPAKPSAILSQPGNIKVNFSYANGVAGMRLPGVSLYTILEIKN